MRKRRPHQPTPSAQQAWEFVVVVLSIVGLVAMVH